MFRILYQIHWLIILRHLGIGRNFTYVLVTCERKSKSQMNSLPETYLVASQAGMVKIKQWWIPSTGPSPPPDIFP